MSAAITAPIGSFVNAYPNKKFLGYGFVEQMKDFLPAFLLSITMGVCVYVLSKTIMLTPWLLMPVLIVAGGLIYVLGAKLFKLESFDYILNTIKELRKK